MSRKGATQRLRVRTVSTIARTTAIAATTPGLPRFVNASSTSCVNCVLCVAPQSAARAVHAEAGVGIADEQGQDGEHEPAGGEHDQREAEREPGGRLGVEPGRETQPWRAVTATRPRQAEAASATRAPTAAETMTRAMRGMGMRGSAQR